MKLEQRAAGHFDRIAGAHHIATLTDLKSHAGLRLGLSQEFIGRADGWAGLKVAYDFPWTSLRGFDHGLAYDALLHKIDLATRFPKQCAAIALLADRIDDSAMRRMNAAAKLDNLSFDVVAHNFLSGNPSRSAIRPGGGKASGDASSGTSNGSAAKRFWATLFGADFVRLAVEHVGLVMLSLAASVLIGVPLGVAAARHPRWGAMILGGTGMLQTIP